MIVVIGPSSSQRRIANISMRKLNHMLVYDHQVCFLSCGAKRPRNDSQPVNA